jgi:hypothetical protein
VTRPGWTARVARFGRPARVLVPVLIGAVALVAALLYPRSDVPGGVHTGPRGLARVHPVVLDFRPAVTWGPHRRTVVLIVRPRRPCSVRIGPVTSTAPGRIEVSAEEQGSTCRGGGRRVERFLLPLPTLPDSRHFVRVDVDTEILWLLWAAEPPRHPSHRSDV